MGNSHGHRHKHRNSLHPPPTYKYDSQPQQLPLPIPIPQGTSNSNNNNMISLPYTHLDSTTLRALAGNAEGFGRFAMGGFHGPLYHVTSLSDDGPGSLRDACRKKEPLWIVFEISGTILLSSYLSVSSYKTIDGRGQRIKLTGKGLRLKECEHVIVCNLEFEGGRGPDVDGIQIKPNSKHIWIDRCSLRDFDDGLIDITRESTDITISRCHFSQHDKTILIGADPSHVGDRCMRVTIHHCFFNETRQRHPRVRYAKVHLYNNYTRGWGIYAVCASVESQIFSQHNIYEAGQKKVAFKYLTEKAADKESGATGQIRSEGDLFLNGAQPGLMNEDVGCNMFHPSEYYPTWTVKPPTDDLKQLLHHCTGWQSVARPPDQTACAE
ncbi:PREDICTED: probable pectate lyase 4 [Lupinus angustifolius]|nr:PREDICTED: probable pectate lyase 4 [Lupinus angustifolius]XP_019436143.1 PREDICTED: probable pectate lyase 4 [Lupinus angustifolius]XP_019436145.1 PREDICTED: probable pectate lyase 4 [Lupinus angustifolius]